MATKFAKRHYIAIARLMAEQPNKDQTWQGIVDGLVVMFKADNYEFKPARFRDACRKA
jgi:hypothetical protein